MCARISVGKRQAGGAHLFTGGLWSSLSVCWGRTNGGQLRGRQTLGLKANSLLYLVGDGHGECAGDGDAMAGCGCGQQAAASDEVKVRRAKTCAPIGPWNGSSCLVSPARGCSRRDTRSANRLKAHPPPPLDVCAHGQDAAGARWQDLLRHVQQCKPSSFARRCTGPQRPPRRGAERSRKPCSRTPPAGVRQKC